MEQLQLLGRESPLRVRLPQEVRDELVSRMVEAIMLVFKTESEENDELVTPQDPT